MVTQPSEGAEEFWHPPRPQFDEPLSIQNPKNKFLLDLDHELSVLILERPDNERQLAHDSTTLADSSSHFSRLLGCQDCELAALFECHPC